MKKNISINISGIIFHIEEDAFDKLKTYLDSINSYFSSFDDSHEIIADIESRIAEIFLSKLSDEKQVITLADVESLMSTMGSIRDFQAIEEPEIENGEHTSSNKKSNERTTGEKESKKLFRDEKRRLIGGVCAGVAHHLNIDPLWIRLLFLILLLGSFGSILLVYIVMWAVIPASSDLSDDSNLKKMFRDSEHKVIAGVASGVANYFGVDVVIIRVLLVISMFIGGMGVIAYIMLWLILPEAKSISDKVQMKGDPVTLSNIEDNIKQSLNVKDDEDENVFVKLLLFPFRLIALILGTIGKAIGPFLKLLVDFVRVIAGAMLMLIGFVAIIALIVCIGVVIGIFSTDIIGIGHLNFGNMGIPLETMTNGLPGFTALAAFLVAIIPFFFMLLLGASIIARRIIFNSNTGWTLFAAFIISVVVLAINVPSIVFNFSDRGEYTTSQTYELGDKTAILKLRNSGLDEYHVTSLTLEGYSGNTFKLEQTFEAQGRSRMDAVENAKMVDYNVDLDDSVLWFDSNLTFQHDAIFRAQRLDMTLYIPYNQKFVIDYDLEEILRNTIYRNGYRVSDLGSNNTWIFTKDGLECITCTSKNESWVDRSYEQSQIMRPFDVIDIQGAFTINIEKSDVYEVLVNGPNDVMDYLEIDQELDKLQISFQAKHPRDIVRLARKKIEITIHTPKVSEIELTGACKAYMSGFDLKDIKFDLTGASMLKANINADKVTIELDGASKLDMRGKGKELNADVTGASQLDSDNFEVEYAVLETNGISSINAFVTKNATVDEDMASNIKIRGSASINSTKKRY